MTNLESCFFCCENISQISRNEELEELFNTLDYDTFGSTVTDHKTTKENVLRISSYLTIPRTIIDQDIKIIKTCQQCTKITTNLSDFCIQLETVQMKINHYLNLLTVQIKGISEEHNGSRGRPLNMSNFQKIVHQKCLLKVQNAENNAFPQIRLKKCPNLPQLPAQDIKLEEIPDHPEIYDELELEDQLKMEDDPTIAALPTNDVLNEELHSCPFCTFVVQGAYEELHSHITSEHPEHLQTDQDETSFFPNINPNDRLNETHSNVNEQHSNSQFKCNNCEKSFTQVGNLRRHLRMSLICHQEVNPQIGFWGNFECSNCKRRYTRRDYLKYHLKHVCKNGLLVDLGSGKKIGLSNSAKKVRTTKFSTCEHCGMLVHSKNLRRHVNLKHANGNKGNMQRREKTCEICGVPFGNSGNFRNHMLLAHGVSMPVPETMYKCEKCNKSFEIKRSLRRHKCKVDVKDIVVVSNQPIVEKREEREEPVLLLSIPETEYDTNMIMNRGRINFEDDPLKI